MKRYRIAPFGRLDLDEIYVYIARDNPAAARRWLKKAMEQFSWLAKNPDTGQALEELRPNLRCISHGPYVIYFRKHSDHVQILRVLHGARDHTGLI
jgi:toxin ParE1/3/4